MWSNAYYLPRNRTVRRGIYTPSDVEFGETGEKVGNVIEEALVVTYDQISE
jgi:hypothetical protein